MCNPVALAWTSLALTAASAGVSAYNQRVEGRNAQTIAEYNAAIARNDAKDTIARGRIEEDTQRRRTAAQIGTQRANFGASGVQLDTGSPSDILVDTAIVGETDALTIRANAQRDARRLEQQANLDQFQGRAAKQAGNIRATSSILSGAGKVASQWYSFNKAGTI